MQTPTIENTDSNWVKRLGMLVAFFVAVVFLLLHTNQRSSQSMASFVLFLGPCMFFLMNTHTAVALKQWRWLLFFVTVYSVYNFLIFTTHPVSQVSFGKFRDLMFWLVLPVSLLALHVARLNYRQVFYLFIVASIIGIWPVISDYLTGDVRGNSSAQPMYWGGITLSTGVIAFVLSRYWPPSLHRVAGYFALILGLSACLWSQTRGSWISIPFSLALMLYFGVIRWWHLLFVGIVLIVIVLSVPDVKKRLTDSLSHARTYQTYTPDYQASTRTSSQQRLDMWRFAWPYLWDKPVTGLGLAAYKEKIDNMHIKTGRYKGIRQNKNVHNEYLEIVLSRGFLGLFIFSMIIASSLYLLVRKVQGRVDTYIRISGVLLVVQCLIFGLTALFFSAKYPLVYFCVTLALLLSIKHTDTRAPVTAENHG